MSFLAKIEQACAVFIERAFAKTFPSDLEPAQIARKLISTMEAQTREHEGRLRAPGSYVVGVSPVDFKRLADHQTYLEREWAELLRDLGTRVGVEFFGEPRVAMVARESVPLGAIEIDVADAAAAVARFRLRMIKGVPPDGVYSIEGGRARVGRNEESEVVLLDPSVSRIHAVVELDGVAPRVRDLGSTNGTFVNGERVADRALCDGDELTFGNTRMRFEAR
jgi:Protein of unknown function (DUF3662)/FHA domain